MDLFLGNIPFKYKESDIHQIFDGLGNVSKVKLTLSNITKQNKGFCFVTMPVDEEAQKAIEALNGKEIDGKKLELVKVEGSIAEWEKRCSAMEDRVSQAARPITSAKGVKSNRVAMPKPLGVVRQGAAS